MRYLMNLKKAVILVMAATIVTGAIAAMPSLVYAQGGDNLIQTCVNENTGSIRIISPESSCRPFEYPLELTTLNTNADKLIFSTCLLSPISIAQNEVKNFECPVPGAQFDDHVIASSTPGLNIHTIGALVTSPGMVLIQVQNLQTDVSGAGIQFEIAVFHVSE